MACVQNGVEPSVVVIDNPHLYADVNATIPRSSINEAADDLTLPPAIMTVLEATIAPKPGTIRWWVSETERGLKPALPIHALNQVLHFSRSLPKADRLDARYHKDPEKPMLFYSLPASAEEFFDKIRTSNNSDEETKLITSLANELDRLILDSDLSVEHKKRFTSVLHENELSLRKVVSLSAAVIGAIMSFNYGSLWLENDHTRNVAAAAAWFALSVVGAKAFVDENFHFPTLFPAIDKKFTEPAHFAEWVRKLGKTVNEVEHDLALQAACEQKDTLRLSKMRM